MVKVNFSFLFFLKSKKGFFFSLLSLLLVILLVSLSHINVSIDKSSSDFLLDSLFSSRELAYVESIEQELFSLYNITLEDVSYVDNNGVLIFFDSFGIISSSKNYRSLMNNYVLNVSTSFGLAASLDVNSLDASKIYLYPSLFQTDFSLIEENTLFQEFLSEPKNISFSIFILDKDLLSFSNFSVPLSTGNPLDTYVDIEVFDQDGDFFDSFSGYIDMSDDNDFKVNFTSGSEVEIYLGTRNSDMQMNISSNGVMPLLKNYSLLFLNVFDHPRLQFLQSDFEIGFNSRCVYNEDCLFSETCVYGTCVEDVLLYFDFYNHNLTSLLDSGVEDHFGNVFGNVTLGDGIDDYACLFDGVNGYINISDSSNFLFTDNFSISLWMKVFGTEGRAIAKGVVGECCESDGGQGFYISGSPSSIVFKMEPKTAGIDGEFISSFGSYENSWVHVVGVKSDRLYLYVNGEMVSNSSILPSDFVLGSGPTSNDPLVIGASVSFGVSHYFNGSIDDVFVFNRSLSTSEVIFLFNNTRQGYIYDGTCQTNNDCTFGEACVYDTCYNNVVSYFSFEEYGEDFVLDQSGFGLQGSLNGSTLIDVDSRDHVAILNSAGDFVYVGNEDLLDFNSDSSFSLSAFFKMNDADIESSSVIISKRDDSSFKTGWGLFVRGDVLGNPLEFTLTNNYGVDDLSVQFGSIIDTSWHHVLVTYDGSKDVSGVNMYLDGVLQAPSLTTNLLSGSITNSFPVVIGSINEAGTIFNGSIDEVLVFNRTLTQTEVFEIYSGVLRR